MNNIQVVLLSIVFAPFVIYFVVKAGRAGWLAANRTFFTKELKRTINPEDFPNGDE